MIEAFKNYSLDRLSKYSREISICLEKLTEDELWTRGSDEQNSVGNLVLHLCGNLSELILSAVAGEPFVRDRPAEFAARGGDSAQQLANRLKLVVDHVQLVIQSLTPQRLEIEIVVRNRNYSVLTAVYHAVEHFAYHAGQILYATKMMRKEDLGFTRA